MDKQCWCGKALAPWFYQVANGQYDAWQGADAAADGVVEAASRDDVLTWQTSFRTPAHDVINTEGHTVCQGQCRELFGEELA